MPWVKRENIKVPVVKNLYTLLKLFTRQIKPICSGR